MTRQVQTDAHMKILAIILFGVQLTACGTLLAVAVADGVGNVAVYGV
jgi:hypothetical protein